MRPTALFALCALPFSAAHAASFDCSKASHPTEKIICADTALSKQDEALAATYKARLGLAMNKGSITRSQRDFVKSVRSECRDAPCITTRYDARLAELKGPFSETFLYNYKTADAYDVTFSDHSKEGFRFTSRHYYLDTPEENLCSMKASLQAKYTSGGKAEYTEKGCRITFIPDLKLNGAWMDTDIKGCETLCVYSGLGGRYEALE